MPSTSEPGGMRNVLQLAFPLILASSSTAVKIFTDRVMLAHYSGDSFSAGFSAGITAFTIGCLFLGIILYTSTFVAQYTGAKKPFRVGSSVWQGIYFALIAGVILFCMSFLSGPIFRMMGHGDRVLGFQISYFRILMQGWILALVWQAVVCFWSGRGKTWTVAGIEGIAVVVNVLINYALIFGHYGLPELGITGAAIGTVASNGVGMVFALILFTLPRYRETFGTWPPARFDTGLFTRLLRYGFPNGLQFCLDLLSFNLFVFLTHKISHVAKHASTIAFSINAIAFIPMIGIGVAASIFVGQAIGGKNIPMAKRAVKNALILIVTYAVVMSVIVLVGGMSLMKQIFPLEGISDLERVEAFAMARMFLFFMMSFLVFDGVFILFSNAIKGAGDTRFAMWGSVAMAWGVFAIPCAVVYWLNPPGRIWIMWAILVFYAICASIVFYIRYRGGRWQQMSVIDESH